MKRSDNTEMDRLLRRHARLSNEALRATSDTSDGETGGAHLDADELNAYAEGALSDTARSRYFTHLADCDTCRKLVTDLTLAASVAVEGKGRALVAEASPSRSWRDWLAALFSPPVLRYGAPALALLAVIVVVAIVAMRTNRETDSVAQRSEDGRNYSPTIRPSSNSATGDTTTTTGTEENHPSSNAAPLAEPQSQTRPDVSATPAPAKNAPMEADSIPATQENAPKPVAGQAKDAKDSSGEFGIVTGRREQQTVATAPPPPSNLPVLSAPATTTTGADNRDKREEQKKAKVAGKDDDETIVSENAVGGAVAKQTAANEDRRDVGRTMTTRPAQRAPRSRASTASKSGPVDRVEEKEASTETQSVGGRRFRKQGSAWVDTAYNSSRSITNVSRGSEQYRALVADEPGLRTITQQLDGEVIVVWKSRAYRFY